MFDEIFDALQDGKSHSFTEILGYLRSKCHSPIPSEKKVQLGLALLKEYDFVNSFKSGNEESWYLCKAVARFWKRIKQMEN